MEVTFDSKKVEKMANSNKVAVKLLGPNCAKKFFMRLAALISADNLEDLRYAPGRFHELSGERKGQWACDLEHPYRMLFVPHENPIPKNADGNYLWVEIKGVEVIEIVDYH